MTLAPINFQHPKNVPNPYKPKDDTREALTKQDILGVEGK